MLRSLSLISRPQKTWFRNYSGKLSGAEKRLEAGSESWRRSGNDWIGNLCGIKSAQTCESTRSLWSPSFGILRGRYRESCHWFKQTWNCMWTNSAWWIYAKKNDIFFRSRWTSVGIAWIKNIAFPNADTIFPERTQQILFIFCQGWTI